MHNLNNNITFKEWFYYFASKYNINFTLSQKHPYIFNANNITIIFIDINNYNHAKEIISFAEKNTKHIIIWEDQWITKKAIICSRIFSIFNLSEKIFARKTQCFAISKDKVNAFMLENHLNINASAKYFYGLFLNDNLIAAASFSEGKIFKQYKNYTSYELVRFANKLNYTVIGGLSKLIKLFINDINPSDIVTYSDSEWSDGNSYIKLGFTYEKDIDNQHFFINPSEGTRYYLHRLPKNIKNPENEGYIKISNQGSKKFRLQLKNTI